MPNAWTNHVKQFAKENNLSYGCALSNPQCSASYKSAKPVKPKSTFSKLPNLAPLGPRVVMPTKSAVPMSSFFASALDEPVKKQMKISHPKIIVDFIPPPASKGRGRPPVYTTADERKKAKFAMTVASNKRRREEKRAMAVV